MSWRDNITRRGAKGLWIGRLCEKKTDPIERKLQDGRPGGGKAVGDILPSDTATVGAYKEAIDGRVRVHGMCSESLAKVAPEFQFEAVLGKTHRTEF